LESKIEVDDDLKEIFEDFKSNLKDSREGCEGCWEEAKQEKGSDTDEPKKKRAPSVLLYWDVMP
jgi:hypothetical protein